MVKKIIIFLLICLLFLIVITIIITNSFKLKNQPNNSKTIYPTTVVDYNYPNKKIDPTSTNKQIGSSILDPKIAKSIFILPNKDQQLLEQLKDKLPYKTNDFEITYSALFNKFIVQKKTGVADYKLMEWLKKNKIGDILSRYNLIIYANQPIDQFKKEIENNIITSLSISSSKPNAVTTPATDTSSSANSTINNKEIDIFTEFFIALFSINFASITANINYPTDPSQLYTTPPLINTPPVIIPTTLTNLLTEIGNKVGVPEKILEAVLSIESPHTFNLSTDEISLYSIAGNSLPGCKPNLCSAIGPMQMTIGVDDYGDTSCPRCGAGYCPNAWSSYGNAVNNYGGYNHQSNSCNIKDNIYAAASKLKNDSRASDPNNWTQEQVYRAALSYYGSCDDTHRYERLGNRTYCEYVWWYYNNQNDNSSIPIPSPALTSNSNFVYYCQNNSSWKNVCDLGYAGCAPTTFAMILSSFGVRMLPPDVDNIFRQNGWRSCNTDGSLTTTAINSSWLTSLGFRVENNIVNGTQLNIDDAKKYINEGYLIIASSKQYPSSHTGRPIDHVFIIDNVDISNNAINIRDPNNCDYNDTDNVESSLNRIHNVSDFPWLYAYPIKKI